MLRHTDRRSQPPRHYRIQPVRRPNIDDEGTSMKKIALMMDSWRRYMIAAWPIGIIEELKKKQVDASLYIFCCAGNWNQDEAYNEGEYGILSLPNFNEFDGVIVDLSNMHSGKEVNLLTDQIRHSGIPAVSLQKQIDGFTYVGADNYTAMRQLVAHLHEDHHMDRFWLMMGPENNYESDVREQGIRDYLKENGLHLAKDDVVHVDFDYQAGVRGYHILRSMHQELPEAIICVNDNQAIAACEEAVRDGFTVPDDFAVTGFDNFDKAGFYAPRITTMSNVREKLSARAVDVLLDAWNGKPMPEKVYNPVDFLKYESCGCHPPLPDIRQNLKKQVLENIDGDKYASELLDLESVMPKCNTIEEVAKAVDEQLELMRGDAFYLMVDPKVFAVNGQISAKPNARENLTSSFCRGCYPLQMQIVYAREGEKRERDFEGQMISDIFPMLSLDAPAEDYLFMPIHFEESSIGYVAFKNVIDILDKQMYFQAVMTIQRRIQELYNAAMARQVKERLSLLYKTDELTGVLNRLGYNEEGSAYYEQHHRRGQQIYVMFCDLDRLKYINDNYGHKAGDRAIIDIANTLREVLGKDSVIARMGGDEFVVMGTFVSKDDLNDIREAVRTKLQALTEEERLPYDLTVSMGARIADASSTENLEHFVREADERMYAEKLKHRALYS